MTINDYSVKITVKQPKLDVSGAVVYNPEQSATIHFGRFIKGDPGKDAPKLIRTEFDHKDADGGNVYRQTYSDGSTQLFTAPRGEIGSQGPKGEKGDTGERGQKGDTGATGPQGPKGEQGVQGPNGEKGPKGEDGTRIVATEWVGPDENGGNIYRHIFSDGSSYTFVAPRGEIGYPGPRGPEGQVGPMGPQGPKGETGNVGPRGPQGETGATGPQGPIGNTGPQGPTGPMGPIGPQGPQGACNFFVIRESDCTIEQENTAGTAPYSTSSKYTNVIVNEDAGCEWIEGAFYTFIVDTSLVVASTYRNVRIKIGEDDTWHPVMGYSTSILAGSTYFVKNMVCVFQYKSTIRPEGALHLNYNPSYAYLVNTIPAGSIVVDENGYGARYSLMFPTTKMGTQEKWSSLVKSSSTVTTKVAATCTFYADRHCQYVASDSIAAGAASANVTFQNYAAHDVRYTANTSSSWVSVNKRVFLWLKDFNPEDMSFKADNTIGNILSIDKLSTKFPNTTQGDVYLYLLGWNSSTWYTIWPMFEDCNLIWKYNPSSGALTPFVMNAGDNPMPFVRTTGTSGTISLGTTSQRGYHELTVSGDIALSLTINNNLENYILVHNSGSAEATVIINSVNSVSTVLTPDEISVEAGKYVEISVLQDGTKAVVTCSGQLS